MRRRTPIALTLPVLAAVGTAGLVAGPGTALARTIPATAASVPSTRLGGYDLDRTTIPQLQQLMNRHRLSSAQLVSFYEQRIGELNPRLHAVISTNPNAAADARRSDSARRRHGQVGVLEGIPVLLKDNIDTGDAESTTAGSYALIAAHPHDAFLVARLRAAGAVILGKANLSEWANFRSTSASSGWSAVGGQTNNPYALNRNPCGSSSGSAAGVAADLATVAVGTETDGSIVCPAGQNGDVGIKPTLGLVSRTGVVPISAQQDTAGPIARNVTDASVLLGALTGVDPADSATAASARHTSKNYNPNLRRDALAGARVGIWRQGVTGTSSKADAAFGQTVKRLRELGATVIDPANLPNVASIGTAEGTALDTEFHHDINAYLHALPGLHPGDLAGLISYNNAHRSTELRYFGQETFLQAQAATASENDPAYRKARAAATATARASIDNTLSKYKLDAVLSETNGPAWTTDLLNGDPGSAIVSSSTPAAVAGYPSITVPSAYSFGLPLGVSFTGGQWSEPRLLALAYAFEQGTLVRVPPQFRPIVPSQTGPTGTTREPAQRTETTTR